MNDGEPQSFKKQLPNDQTSREWWRQQWSFTRKELQETLRDPRTIGTLLLMPLLLYPLLGMVLRFLAIQGVMNPIQEYRIAFENEQTAGIVSSMLQRGEEELAKELPAEDTSKPKSLWRTIVPNKESSFNLADAISAGVADVGVRLDAPINNTETDRSGLRLKIVIAKDYGISRTAGTIVRERLRAFSLLMVTSINEDINHPSPGRVEQSVQYVPMLSEDIGILGLLPLVILLLTVTGGVYPAIDLTAGERERDTLETLVALPVPMVRILAAKYVSVLAVTLLTGLVNVIAMTVTGYALGLQSTLLGDAALSPRLVLSFLLVLTVFGAFYSAILLLLASTARSFKEAQAFLIPLMLLSITPAVAVLIPSWRLDGLLSIVPLVNMLLVAKELFEGTIHPLPAFVAVTSTLVYAAAALAVAARRFGSDALVVGGQMSWADVLRRPKSGRDVPAMHTTLLTLGAILPLHFIATGILGQSKTWSPSSRLMASAIFTALLFGGLPASVVWWNRLQWRATFRLYVPSLLVFPAAILLGVATWPWIHEVVLWSRSLGIQVLDDSKVKAVQSMLESWKSVSPWLIVGAIGVAPGIFEELFFRGFLLGALRRSLQVGSALMISSIIFGLFHVILSAGAAPERFLPSTIMGMILGWLLIRTGSIVPSMVMHVCHNSLLLVMATKSDDLGKIAFGESVAEHLPAIWLIASAVAISMSAVWMYVISHRDFNRSTMVGSKESQKE